MTYMDFDEKIERLRDCVEYYYRHLAGQQYIDEEDQLMELLDEIEDV